MHTPFEEDYHRGYEWWLMQEAKARNPDIKLYGLSWAFPQWVTCTPGTLTNCTGQNPCVNAAVRAPLPPAHSRSPEWITQYPPCVFDALAVCGPGGSNRPFPAPASSPPPYSYVWPEQLAGYITKWVAGAKNTYGLDIDYIGSWNERGFDATYLKTLRKTLDFNGFNNTKIIASDSGWDPISTDVLNDPDLAAAVHGIGCHYPGMSSSASAIKTGKPLWASEDDSTYDNDVGAECFARIISRNYVVGSMGSTINWNLVSSYTKVRLANAAARHHSRHHNAPF